MKQNITTEQFKELSPENQRELFEFFFHDLIGHPIHCTKNVWYGPVDINPEYITIGKMIEFLDEHEPGLIGYSSEEGQEKALFWKVDEELADSLWEEVKEILENKM